MKIMRKLIKKFKEITKKPKFVDDSKYIFVVEGKLNKSHLIAQKLLQRIVEEIVNDYPGISLFLANNVKISYKPRKKGDPVISINKLQYPYLCNSDLMGLYRKP